MKNAFQSHLHWLVFGLFALLFLSTVGPVMRESDQASLLDGALQLARDGQLVARDFYNYDKQFGSYWILAFLFRVTGLQAVGSAPDAIVELGNWASGVCFLLGLGSLFRSWKPTGWELLLVGLTLASPILLFSVPFLSSNLFSAAFLCFLASKLRKPSQSLRSDLAVGLVGFVAVACRADAVLLMPWLCLLASREEKVSLMIRERRFWILAAGSVLALAVGVLLSSRRAASYEAFFQPQVAAAFLVFGLGGALLAYGALLGGIAFQLVQRKEPFILLALGAALLPLVFYGRILFTPRHLTTTLLVLLLSFFFQRGRSWWALLERPLAKGVVLAALVLPFLIGIRLHSASRGRPVVTQPTLFPSADGYWPMGCQAQFLTWLAQADQIPLDHNQRVWEAWTAVSELEDQPTFYSTGLMSFGPLMATITGKVVEPRWTWSELTDGTFYSDGRTVVKNHQKMGVDGPRDVSASNWPDGRVIVGESTWEQIFRMGEPSEAVSSPLWEIKLALSEVSKGDDLVVGRVDSPWQELRGGGPFRWFAIQDKAEAPGAGWKRVAYVEPYWIHESVSSSIPETKSGWLARSSLPEFFKISRYGK
ncbi:MAG: hypothetical protein Q7Q71_03685 [Verrucomicrobiota bacterium JB023]|nr:hypothetical protein [Verrucomicrobiota bacterium JB023]